MSSEDNSTLSCILEKVFPTGNIPEAQIAFVIAICTTVLDPDINAKESIMRSKIDHYLVDFCKFILVLNCNI